MSQEKLGEAIGLTFQQVQKYERGSNRISAGTLYRLGQVLDVPVSFFFDCYDDPTAATRKVRSDDAQFASDSVISRREARLLRLWRAAPDAIADELLALLGSLSPHLREGRDGIEEDGDAPVAEPDAPPAPSRAESGARTKEAGSRGKESGGQNKAESGKHRRRHGAVWDPADIYRAAKAESSSRG